MINDFRKNKISSLADFVSNEFSAGNITDLQRIMEYEEIYLHEDSYGDAFDGALVLDQDKYHIHVNKDKGNYLNSTRGRFTIAHELGHYFIEDHHKNLINSEPHFSSFSIKNSNVIEREADYFASCLLFPQKRFHKVCERRKFSAELILELSDTFKASKIAAVKRFCEIGTHEIFAVYSQNNQVRWYDHSRDFPFMKLRFKIGSKPPKDSVASEFYKNENVLFTERIESYSGDWFYDSSERKMYEQGIGSREYNYLTSILWFD